MSSDTPPSIPPRSPSGRETGKQGATTPTSSTPAPKDRTPAKPAGTPARPSTVTAPAAAPTAPARKPAGAASTATATQEAVRPAARTTGTTATAATAAPAGSAGPAQQDRAAGTPAKPAARPVAGPLAASTGPRRVRLAVSRVDPWSVMKLSFLVSVAIGIMIVVASAVVWLTLDSLEVFARLDGLITEILADSDFDIMKYVEFDRVISVSTLIAVVDVFLITALATIGAFLYNIVAALVGGVHVTMTDD